VIAIEKLLDRARNFPSGITFDELCRLADNNGFIFRRQAGSHKIYKHPQGAMMNFQPDKNGMAKTYQVKQLLDFIDCQKEAENV
jgi:hypothetical protein